MAYEYAAALTEERLEEIVRRIVEVADPVKIVLFGSAARGDMTRHSDADFLVVIESGPGRNEINDRIRQSLWEVDVPLDIVVVTTRDIEEHKDKPYYVIYPALQEGRLVYERSPVR